MFLPVLHIHKARPYVFDHVKGDHLLFRPWFLTIGYVISDSIDDAIEYLKQLQTSLR
jgi:hypothetical protein